MKIVLTGSGSGGHFYPLIAVAEQIRTQANAKNLLDPELIYIGPQPFDKQALAELDIEFVHAHAGKLRRYRSILNIFDGFKTAWGIVQATMQLYSIYPDVVFSKGGYASFPTLVAAKILRIPVVIHESDASVGRANMFAASFARAIGIAHPETAKAFPKKVQDKIALVGNPIRHELETTTPEGGHEFLKLKDDVPTILILGGSLGAQSINDVVMDAIPTLVEKYNIIHQTGAEHLEEVKGLAGVRLKDSRNADRYRAFGLLNALALQMAAGISSLIVSRAGSGSIFEIASWGVPSILVPMPEDVSHDQTKNAFSYAKSGASQVMVQRNLTPHLFVSEIGRIMNDPGLQKSMSAAAKAFAKPEAASKVASVVIETALEHAK